MERRHFIKTLATASTAGIAATAVSTNASPVKAEKTSAIKLASDIAGDLQFSKAEFERRYANIRAQMAEQEIDCLVIGGNREWREGELSNLRYVGADIDWEPTFVIFPLNGTPIVPTKSGSMAPPFVSRGTMEFEYIKSPVREGTRNASNHAPTIARHLKSMGLSKGRIGLVSPRVLPAELLLEVQKELPNAEYLDAERIFLDLRTTRSEEENRFVRRSAHCADKGIEALIEAAQVGNTDWDLLFAMDKACTEAGAPPGGLQLLSSGPWRGKRSFPLFFPNTARTLEPGDVIIPEVTSNYKGYYTQVTVPIVLGEPGKQFLADYELCEKVHPHMETKFRPGISVKELDDYCAAFTKEVSGGRVSTLFGYQVGEHEISFWHDNTTLNPGVIGYNQPFFIAPGGPPWHVYGDALICTDDEPVKLHQTPMRGVYV